MLKEKAEVIKMIEQNYAGYTRNGQDEVTDKAPAKCLTDKNRFCSYFSE